MITVIALLIVLTISNLMLWHSTIKESEILEEMVDEFVRLERKSDKEVGNDQE